MDGNFEGAEAQVMEVSAPASRGAFYGGKDSVGISVILLPIVQQYGPQFPKTDTQCM